MDAFGAIGVYRYIEIYLLREVNEQLNQKILHNALKRYNHCLKYYHEYRLNTTDLTFKFDCLTKILTDKNFPDPVNSLIEWINEEIIIPETDPYEFFIISSKLYNNQTRRSFFIKCILEEYNET